MRPMLKYALCIVSSVTILTTAAMATNMMSMQYRMNEVNLSSAEGITINSGTFTVNSFQISPGQDPEDKNFVGQVHSLDNGKFIFEVGRSASETVATWFNEKLSGYNDSTLNGDRTTFDQTAGKLNFAFVGDLNLNITSQQSPEGIQVQFPDVAFAQGSTMFSNNWWFGQLTGQHTRDSDGPDTVLAIGSTNSGETVYASFLRGYNDVNTVSLEAICVVSPAVSHPNKVTNALGSFEALPVDGVECGLEGFPGSYEPTVNHIQGYAQYTMPNGVEFSLLTHSVGTAPYAHIVAGPTNGTVKWGFKTYLQGWRHPGGIQTIGDYLLVPSETEGAAHIALYDMRSLAVGELRRVESFDFAVDHKAGALGITTYTASNNQEYYCLTVAHLDGVNTVYHVYTASAVNGIEYADFSEVGSFALAKDFQGFGLITEETTNHIYMVGLWAPTEGATFADYAYLHRLDTNDWSISPMLKSAHLVSGGSVPGIMGVHFRYGASVRVSDGGKLILYATERNSVLGSTLMTNAWEATA